MKNTRNIFPVELELKKQNQIDKNAANLLDLKIDKRILNFKQI